MTASGWAQIGLYVLVLLALVRPLGAYMARVYEGRRTFLHPVLAPLEQAIYRLAGVRADDEMPWHAYAGALLAFSVLSTLAVYLLLRVQGYLPLNPRGFAGVPPFISFNTASSYATNTDWQAYGGETTLSYLTQMLGLTVQNFCSAAAGMAVLVALIRGLTRHTAQSIGSFWVDLTRGTLYILLPLSLVLALLLVSQGVVQTLGDYRVVPLWHPEGPAGGVTPVQQVLALGPAASQIAIKQLGSNGGGFFNANSAHPFENPTPLSNFLEALAMPLIPAALCYTYGVMVRDTRQGWAVLAAMVAVFVVLLGVCAWSEGRGNPILTSAGVSQAASGLQPGGNMEGKEVRFGIAGSALWATVTTAVSNGSVNSMLDSFTPLGGLMPMWLMQLGEVIFGGTGSGLYGMLAFVIVAVFVAGLMVGRTPEYLGKKIEAFEIKMAALMVLIPPALVLCSSALAMATTAGQAAAFNRGPHGYSEILYAFSSMGNNNGSAFAGLNVSAPLYTLVGGAVMLCARFIPAISALAIAGSLARKQVIPASAGTLPTHTPLFVAWLIAVVVIVGALSFIPALALGPIAEQLLMVRGATF